MWVRSLRSARKRLIDCPMFEKLTARTPLPSLNGLRAFEAMGRLGSATRAAAELHVTHSAVSRQVKVLEAVLGVTLFEGPKSKLTLTEAGSALLAGLSQGFDTLGDAVRSVQVSNVVRIAIHNSLAVKWLIPRLPTFERLHPGITIELTDLPVDAVRARSADLVVRFLDGDRLSAPGVELLAQNYVGVVLSPEVEDSKSNLPMLAAASHTRGWLAWSEAGRPIEFGARTRTLAHLHHVLDAAVSGLGVAVLPWTLVAEAILSDCLRAPYGFVGDGGHLVACVAPDRSSPAMRRVIDWLRREAKTTTDQLGGAASR